jgi:hypothetical protein
MAVRLRPDSAKETRRPRNYQERYGAPNPYKPLPPRPQSGVEQNREFVHLFSKGISASSHYDIILGPKRPASASVGRSSEYSEAKGATSVRGERNSEQAPPITDDFTDEDEKILSIRYLF